MFTPPRPPPDHRASPPPTRPQSLPASAPHLVYHDPEAEDIRGLVVHLMAVHLRGHVHPGPRTPCIRYRPGSTPQGPCTSRTPYALHAVQDRQYSSGAMHIPDPVRPASGTGQVVHPGASSLIPQHCIQAASSLMPQHCIQAASSLMPQHCIQAASSLMTQHCI